MKNTLLLCLLLTASSFLFSQDSPYEKYGFKPKIATMTNGKFIEIHDRDTIVQIGRIVYNTMSKEIIGFVEYDTAYSEATLAPDVVSRWLSPDPLQHMRVWLSPYNFVQNNPIIRIDPDGRLDEPIYDLDGNHLGNTEEGFTGEVLVYTGDKKDIDFSSMSASEAKKLDGMSTYDQQRDNMVGESNSKIWTHVASQMEGKQIYGQEFSMSSIKDGKIGYDFSKYGSWNTDLITGEITGNDRYSYETTVENLQSSIVVHEWYSHFIMGVGDDTGNHSQAYKNVIGYKSLWNNTTENYKIFTHDRLQKYLTKEAKK